MIDTYKGFVRARHQVWRARQAGLPQPWTDDLVLQNRKFTNVFRILDYGTQLVVRDLIHGDPNLTLHDQLMRVFLYRYTNRPEPWEHFRDLVGRYPLAEDLDGHLEDVWGSYKKQGGRMFGNAYKMFSGWENRGVSRLDWALGLTRDYFHKPDFTLRFAQAETPEERLELLKTIPRVADFMGMQILTDIGYSSHVNGNENEFIVAGPGAKLGAKQIEPGRPAEELIRELWAYWAKEGDVVLAGRTPSLMDVQNTFCEFGKYVRWSSAEPARKPYVPQHRAEEPFLPPNWKGTSE